MGQAHLSVARSVALSMLFTLGLAVTTAILGAVTAYTGGIFGQLHPVFRYSFATVPVLIGLHMLGAFPIRLPEFLRLPDMQGYLGAFGAGLAFAFVVLPCGTPVLASNLSYVAYGGEVLYGAGLLFAYGIGSGIPLMMIGTLTGTLAARSWLLRHRVYVAKISGGLLVAIGLYLLRSA